MAESFVSQLLTSHKKATPIPNRQAVLDFTNLVLGMLFPQMSTKKYTADYEIVRDLTKIRIDLTSLLGSMQLATPREKIAEHFFNELPYLYNTLRKDAQAIFDNDPSVTLIEEVIVSYPGFLAIAIYRVAHEIYKWNVPFIPMMMTEYAHHRTGIDIHPGAEIGDGFCIDHGTGVVIGQTAIIGKNVRIHQGVTLGELTGVLAASARRHPILEDNVIVYAGSTISGNVVIGSNSIIGGNMWVTDNVPPNTTLYQDRRKLES
jgi:serine O-acetyltransferase